MVTQQASARDRTGDDDAPVVDDATAVEIWGRVIRGFQATNRLLHSECKTKFGLSEAEVETLLTLQRTPEGSATLNTLSRAAAFSTGGFTKVADRLTAQGLTERAACAEDRRVTYLQLTEHGATVARELTAFVAAVNRERVIDILGNERALDVAAAMTELFRANHASRGS